MQLANQAPLFALLAMIKVRNTEYGQGSPGLAPVLPARLPRQRTCCALALDAVPACVNFDIRVVNGWEIQPHVARSNDLTLLI